MDIDDDFREWYDKLTNGGEINPKELYVVKIKMGITARS